EREGAGDRYGPAERSIGFGGRPRRRRLGDAERDAAADDGDGDRLCEEHWPRLREKRTPEITPSEPVALPSAVSGLRKLLGGVAHAVHGHRALPRGPGSRLSSLSRARADGARRPTICIELGDR